MSIHLCKESRAIKKRAQLHVKAEELANRFAFLALLGSSFVCLDQEGYSATTCIRCTFQSVWPYKPWNSHDGEPGECD